MNKYRDVGQRCKVDILSLIQIYLPSHLFSVYTYIFCVFTQNVTFDRTENKKRWKRKNND